MSGKNVVGFYTVVDRVQMTSCEGMRCWVTPVGCLIIRF